MIIKRVGRTLLVKSAAAVSMELYMFLVILGCHCYKHVIRLTCCWIDMLVCL